MTGGDELGIFNLNWRRKKFKSNARGSRSVDFEVRVLDSMSEDDVLPVSLFPNIRIRGSPFKRDTTRPFGQER